MTGGGERGFKYEGLGNDFVVLDRRTSGVDVSPAVSRALCDRRRGVGADGVLVLLPSSRSAARMVVHNADGSLAEMCGNRFFEAIVRSAMKLTHTLIQMVNPDPYTMHPAGMHRPVVEAVLTGDPKASSIAMHKHTVEFGEILMTMEKAYREKKSTLSF